MLLVYKVPKYIIRNIFTFINILREKPVKKQTFPSKYFTLLYSTENFYYNYATLLHI